MSYGLMRGIPKGIVIPRFQMVCLDYQKITLTMMKHGGGLVYKFSSRTGDFIKMDGRMNSYKYQSKLVQNFQVSVVDEKEFHLST